MDTKKSAYLQSLEFIYDEYGKKHYIYPMKIKDLYRVQDLFSKIDDQFIILNLPAPLIDENGNVVTDENTGEPIINIEPYDAMMELLELALNDTRENIEKWIDIGQIVNVLAMYRCASQLKKKIEQIESEMEKLAGTQ